MPKPILVVNYCVEGLPMAVAVPNLKSIRDVIEGSGANDDYYTFVLPVKGDSHVQVFYDKDLDDNAFFNLRDLIDEKLAEFTENHKTDEEKVMKEIWKYAEQLAEEKPRKKLFPWKKKKR